MKDITPYISPLIESQFPSFYKEEGPQFIALIKSYYEWLEQSNNVIYQSRKLLEYRDIDQTIEDFIVYFKEETLKNVQFDTASNKRLFIKNSLDFYRSKGTERSIDLFFKLVYAQPAQVYYPGDDIFKLSDNKWKIPEYLEVTSTKLNPNYEGKQITGITSGATAFVENYAIKKKINNQADITGQIRLKIAKEVHVFFITNVKGTFQYGETIVFTGVVDPSTAPKIIGSLTELQVITGASDYVVGDIVSLTSNTGFNGKALVTSTANLTGQVDFTLLDGGWGYTTSPKIIISDKSLLINNVSPASGNLNKPFNLFGSLVQPKAYIEFDTLSGGFFQANAYVYTYNSGNVTSVSRIVNVSSNISSATGNAYLSVLSGYLPGSGNVIYNQEQTLSAKIVFKDDLTSVANIMGCSSNNSLIINDIEGGILPIAGEIVYQSNDTHGEWVTALVSNVSVNSGITVINVVNTHGSFISSQRLRGRNSFSNSNISSYSTTIGIYESYESSVISVNITNPGQNYVNNDIVTFESDTGFGAVGIVETDGSGAVSKVRILNGGKDYITAPTVVILNSASPYYFNANTGVDTTQNFISIVSNPFINGQAIIYDIEPGNTPLAGLVPGTVYYAQSSNSSGIKISSTPAGSILNLSKGLTESGHSFISKISTGSNFAGEAELGAPFDFINNMYVYSVVSNTVFFNASLDVSSAENFITLNKKLMANGDLITTLQPHPFANGQAVVYNVAQGNTRIDKLTNNSIYYVKNANTLGIKLAYANGTLIAIEPKADETGHSFGSYTSGSIEFAGEGSLAEFKIASLDDQEEIELSNDFIGGYNLYGAPYLYIQIDGSGNSALSGMENNPYGFPANPNGNLTNATIASMFSSDMYDIGTISGLSVVNPGDDYTLAPFVTIIEPAVAGLRNYDENLTVNTDTISFANGEDLYILNRRSFNGSEVAQQVTPSNILFEGHKFKDGDLVTYSTEVGSPALGGLQNNVSYYVRGSTASKISLSLTQTGATITLVPTPGNSPTKHFIQSGNYTKYGLLNGIIDSNTLKVKRLSLISKIDSSAETYIKGDTSQHIALVTNILNDETFSGLNSIVDTSVVIANGVVRTLKVIDSGYAYATQDIMSFQKEDDKTYTVGLAKGTNVRQGKGTGYFQNTKGFLSQDKYLHDNDFYQDYSYQIISRIPFERYSNMLKKVLHIAGTKFFPAVEIQTTNDVKINSYRKIEISTNFNPFANVDAVLNFIRLPNHKFANGDLITYSVENGRTEIKTDSPINGIKTISVVNPGSYYNSSVNNQIIVGGTAQGNGVAAIFVSNATGNITSVQVLNYGQGFTGTEEPYIAAGITNSFSTGATFAVSSYTGIGNNSTFYVAYANSSGFKLSLTANGSSIVNIITPLPDDPGLGHSIRNLF